MHVVAFQTLMKQSKTIRKRTKRYSLIKLFHLRCNHLHLYFCILVVFLVRTDVVRGFLPLESVQ